MQNKMDRTQKIIRTLVFLCSTSLFAQTSLYVAPKGNDAGQGTKRKPFVSLGMAIAEARKISGNVEIYLTGGTYYLNDPWYLHQRIQEKKMKNSLLKVLIIRK